MIMQYPRFVFLMSFLFVLVFSSLGIASAQDVPRFRVYLAFEDGPTDAYTPEILDILAQYGARASFVISGNQIAGHEYLLQREISEGHSLINHLWSEPGVYAGAPADAVIESYQQTETAIREALGDLLPIYDAQTKMFWQPGGTDARTTQSRRQCPYDATRRHSRYSYRTDTLLDTGHL